MNGTDIYLNFNKIASQHILNKPLTKRTAKRETSLDVLSLFNSKFLLMRIC